MSYAQMEWVQGHSGDFDVGSDYLGMSPEGIDAALETYSAFRAKDISALMSRKDYLTAPMLVKAQ